MMIPKSSYSKRDKTHNLAQKKLGSRATFGHSWPTCHWADLLIKDPTVFMEDIKMMCKVHWCYKFSMIEIRSKA